jgi:hypothetical protein
MAQLISRATPLDDGTETQAVMQRLHSGPIHHLSGAFTRFELTEIFQDRPLRHSTFDYDQPEGSPSQCCKGLAAMSVTLPGDSSEFLTANHWRFRIIPDT